LQRCAIGLQHSDLPTRIDQLSVEPCHLCISLGPKNTNCLIELATSHPPRYKPADDQPYEDTKDDPYSHDQAKTNIGHVRIPFAA
jgi:hypothetical protein